MIQLFPAAALTMLLFITPFGSHAASRIDANGILTQWDQPFPQPTLLTTTDVTAIRGNMQKAALEDDKSCRLSKKAILQTELPLNAQADSFCIGHDREIVWSESTQGLYLCKQDRAVKAMRTSIGSNGLGKSIEGDRKTPIGSYWLGAPRKSDRYGLFIPVGYPNEVDLQAGRTGHSVGIHGPLRIPLFASACSVGSSLEKNWTAGCVAVARDSQIAEVAEWVIENWPVRFHILADKAAK
ncbi:MAG: L,D-transpeptidase family protein [Bdellovibrionaceae bacterium]|nr:L,D-transpeptidase family protein [Pseudobdellovibrionaceae bacterium]